MRFFAFYSFSFASIFVTLKSLEFRFIHRHLCGNVARAFHDASWFIAPVRLRDDPVGDGRAALPARDRAMRARTAVDRPALKPPPTSRRFGAPPAPATDCDPIIRPVHAAADRTRARQRRVDEPQNFFTVVGECSESIRGFAKRCDT
jgi:hypothetical protein